MGSSPPTIFNYIYHRLPLTAGTSKHIYYRLRLAVAINIAVQLISNCAAEPQSRVCAGASVHYCSAMHPTVFERERASCASVTSHNTSLRGEE